MRGFFAQPKDIQIIENITYQKAWQKYQVIKDAFGKQKHQRITKTEFFNYFGITEQEYKQYIKTFIGALQG